MTDDINEKLMQEYLEGRSPVSEAYQAVGKPGPSAELDRAVLAEARAAARAGRDIGSPRWQAWLMPVSLAATVTLCIALVAEVIVLGPLLKTADSPQTFSDTLESETGAPTASPVTAGRQSPAQEMLEQKPQRPADAMEAKQERVNTNYEVETAATMTIEEAVGITVISVARENLNAPAPTSDRMLSQKRRAVQKDDDDAEAAALTVSVQSATPTVGQRSPALESFDQITDESAVILGGAASADTMGGGSGQASGRIEDSVTTARLRTDSPAWPAPDVWLAGIRVLREQGEQQRVEAELDKFREHYPDYPLGELVQGTDED